MKSKGIEFLSVNYGDDAATIKKYVREGKFTFPIGMNGKANNDVANLYGVMAYPTNYLIGPDGKVVAALVGFDEEGLKKEIEKLGVKP